jgi:tRNA1(Val) A37 N6-methylase TrmN6
VLDHKSITEDAILGGRLRLQQPRVGHRIGHDAILLAAACPATAGDRVVELGAGVGAAGLALALRVPGVEVVLVELDEEFAALARENISANALGQRVSDSAPEDVCSGGSDA